MVAIILGKEKSPIPFVIQPEVDKKPVDQKNGFYYRAYVLVGVNVLVFLFVWQVVVIAGHVTLRSPVKHNFEIIETDQTRFHQIIENDQWNKVITYKIRRDGNNQWVLHDFKKDLSVFRMRLQAGTGGFTKEACYATPMIKTQHSYFPSTPDMLAKQIDSFENRLSVQDKNISSTLFSVSEYEVIDREIFGDSVNLLCNDLRLFWIEPLCPHRLQSISNKGRQKRLAENGSPDVQEDQLGCVVCGCLQIKAPIVGGVADVEIDEQGNIEMKCDIAYMGTPVVVKQLAGPCDRPLRNCSKQQPRQQPAPPGDRDRKRPRLDCSGGGERGENLTREQLLECAKTHQYGIEA